MSGRALGDGNGTASSTTRTGHDAGARHLVDAHGGRIDLARKTIAATALALDFDTEGRLDVAERSGGLQVDGVPADLHIGVAVGDGVGSSGVRGPVTDGVGVGTPDTTLLGRDTGSVDVVLGSGLAPVGHVGNSQSLEFLDQSGDQHGLVTRQDGLAERDGLAGLVLGLDGTGTILAVRLVGEGLFDLAILVTVQTTVLGYDLSAGALAYAYIPCGT
jgi:hypothetical protein